MTTRSSSRIRTIQYVIERSPVTAYDSLNNQTTVSIQVDRPEIRQIYISEHIDDSVCVEKNR